MAANRVLHAILLVTSPVILPIQILTTLILGILVKLSFGLLLLPISLVWALLYFPMLGASWLCSKAVFLRNPVGLLGIPWAFTASTYVALMPSMGETESRALKLMLVESWPFTWEFYQLPNGTRERRSLGADCLNQILERVTADPIKRRTLERLLAREPLDPDV